MDAQSPASIRATTGQWSRHTAAAAHVLLVHDRLLHPGDVLFTGHGLETRGVVQPHQRRLDQRQLLVCEHRVVVDSHQAVHGSSQRLQHACCHAGEVQVAGDVTAGGRCRSRAWDVGNRG